ncbi:ornithine decarboxylase [Dacryopinax primogenitus]|uniref:ornithine decarboxylase n=1 Tax=Dacryopinax primogenitus (strain DJM 731) TaxID=1858805 RepID=M5G7L0_DACPD|nr:ornithine decarboxylase [Dacryopinax primogenitus]EJU04719.1 ornithine decarboxylase [Dacryopinax primogenitus]
MLKTYAHADPPLSVYLTLYEDVPDTTPVEQNPCPVESKSPDTHLNHVNTPTSIDEDIDTEDVDGFFADLPPVLRGEPRDVMRRLVRERQAATDGDVDAEKAFFVADLGSVWAQHMKWKRHFPRVHPYYAIKCNPDPYVLRLLASLGAGFDCASYGEISSVLSIRVEPSRIIFANPCKPVSFIRNAAQLGVNMMTFDNVDELHKIARIHPGAQLVLRILTDDSKSMCRLGLKFGATLASVPLLLTTAKSLHLNVIGISFHVGSGCYDPHSFVDAIERAHIAFNIGRDIGYRFMLLDIGGGFESSGFEQASAVVNRALDEYFPAQDGVRVISEPGRFYVASAFSLATNVIARRPVALFPGTAENTDEDEPTIMYYINDGVYGSFNCILFDHQVVHPYAITINRQFLPSEPNPVATCSVWGPTCDGIDCVKSRAILPSGLEIGDWIGFDNMGAYTICAASQFNGFQESAVHYCFGTGQGPRAVRDALRDYPFAK